MRRASLLTATLAGASLLFVASAGAAAPAKLHVSEVRGTVFPARTLVLTLPDSRSLLARDVHVTESGGPVANLQLEPARQSTAQTFGVVLVRDTSLSMQGARLAAELKAARSFAAQRNPNEQLGIVDFNRNATTVLPFTTSQSAIDEALATQPSLGTGTHILDAVALAESMLRDAHISLGSIVVLSDGADTGSDMSLDAVAHRATAQRARIYTVGLSSGSYNPKTLTALAAAGNGQYVRAKTGALAPLFAKLGTVLSNEYLVNYTSLLGPGVRAQVNVSVPSLGTATTTYRTPHAPKAATGGGSSIGTTIVNSRITIVVVALILAAAIALLIIGLLQPRRGGLPVRVAEFVSIRDLQRQHTTPVSAPIGGEPTVRKDRWTQLRETLEIARIKVEPEVLVGGTVIATILTFVLIYALTGSALWALFALGVPFIAREWVMRSLKKQRSRFAEQLPEALQVIASALRSGHSFAGSLAVVVESASEPMHSELQRVVADEQLGVPIQRSLTIVADRMASTDVDQLALVAELQRQAGGDMAEVIDRVAENVRERFDLKRLVETLTTQGRMSRWIVTLLPLVLLLILQFENPNYFHPLISSTLGKVIVILAAGWAVIGSLLIKRIVEIEV